MLSLSPLSQRRNSAARTQHEEGQQTKGAEPPSRFRDLSNLEHWTSSRHRITRKKKKKKKPRNAGGGLSCMPNHVKNKKNMQIFKPVQKSLSHRFVLNSEHCGIVFYFFRSCVPGIPRNGWRTLCTRRRGNHTSCPRIAQSQGWKNVQEPSRAYMIPCAIT